VQEDPGRRHRVNDPAAPVAHAILAQGAIKPTHAHLAEFGGFSERSVANVVGELAGDRLLVRGRPALLGPGMGLVVGVSMGSESVRAGIVDPNGTLQVESELPASPGQLQAPPEHLLDRIRQAVLETLERAFDQPQLTLKASGALALHGVAVAWPAPMSRDKFPGRAGLRHAGWQQRDPGAGKMLTLPEHVARVLGAPFYPDTCHALNDVNAQALAIAFDKARDRALEPDDDRWRVAMVVRVGGGLGAAVVTLAPHARRRLSFIDSRLIVGTNGYAGEFGHLPIEPSVITQLNKDNPLPKDRLARLDYNKAKCSCGRPHHLEAFASGAALARRLKASDSAASDPSIGGTPLLRTIFDGPLDEVQIQAVRDVGRLIGRALASPILMLDPYSITFTGSVAIDELEHGVQLERGVWANGVGDTVKIESLTPEEGAFAGVRGASIAVLRRHVYRQLEQVVERKVRPPLRLQRSDLKALRGR
jgi:predicted NBD/HSP70 family sugar kinase